MIYVIAAVILSIGIFVWWRYTSVARGIRQRDEIILGLVDPIAQQLARGQSPDQAAVRTLALQRHVRPTLYETLKHFERLDLFTSEFTTIQAQGEALLAYWMMHPNELQDPPADVELVENLERKIDDFDATFLVFRYRMPQGHWAGDDWLLGLSGPFYTTDVPYSGIPSAFARCTDKYGVVQPSTLVDWFIQTARGKSS